MQVLLESSNFSEKTLFKENKITIESGSSHLILTATSETLYQKNLGTKLLSLKDTSGSFHSQGKQNSVYHPKNLNEQREKVITCILVLCSPPSMHAVAVHQDSQKFTSTAESLPASVPHLGLGGPKAEANCSTLTPLSIPASRMQEPLPTCSSSSQASVMSTSRASELQPCLRT